MVRAMRHRDLALSAPSRWQAGEEVLVRCLAEAVAMRAIGIIVKLFPLVGGASSRECVLWVSLLF